MKKIGCLHAHYSNIAYIEQAMSAYEAEWLHFVDPALILRLSSDPHFTSAHAQAQVKRQVEWIADSQVDAILITCTNYIALLQEAELARSVPVIKIDEPFFAHICSQLQPQLILFTNPATVEGTMRRLQEYAQVRGLSPQVEAHLIADAFPLLAQGKQEAYRAAITLGIAQLMQAEENQQKLISVGQLSMVDAARHIAGSGSCQRWAGGWQDRKGPASRIGDPLEPLIRHIARELKL